MRSTFSPRHSHGILANRTARLGRGFFQAPRTAKKVSVDQQFLALAQRANALVESIETAEADALDPTTRLIASEVYQGSRKPFLTVFAENSQAAPREKKAVLELLSRFVQVLHLRWLAIRLYGNFEFSLQGNEASRQAILTARKACLKPFSRIGTADETLRSLDLTLLLRAANTAMADLKRLFEKQYFQVRCPELAKLLGDVFEKIEN